MPRCLRDYMETFNDPEGYAISHIGWGLQPRARWSTLGLYDREATIGMDARAFEGNFLFSLGPNNEAAAAARRPVTSTFRCATALCCSTAKPCVRDGRVIETTGLRPTR